MDLYSVMCVRDIGQALGWYETFFGRGADYVIGEEHLWQVGENAYVVLDDRSVRASRVGGAMVTLGVTDFDVIIGRLDAAGIGYGEIETYSNGVRHVEIVDPDGNSLSLAHSPA